MLCTEFHDGLVRGGACRPAVVVGGRGARTTRASLRRTTTDVVRRDEIESQRTGGVLVAAGGAEDGRAVRRRIGAGKYIMSTAVGGPQAKTTRRNGGITLGQERSRAVARERPRSELLRRFREKLRTPARGNYRSYRLGTLEKEFRM